MTNKLEQAARQALEALCQLHFAATERDKKNRVRWFDKAIDESVEAITALREALDEPHKQNCACEICRGCDNADIKAEQAEQEPVAWIDNKTWCFTYSQYEYEDLDDDMTDDLVPLYAAPVRTKDLTDDEIFECLADCDCLQSLKFARSVIAADREKNRGS